MVGTLGADARAGREHALGRFPKRDGDDPLPLGEPFARAQKEGDARPTPIVDRTLECDECFGVGFGVDTVLAAVTGRTGYALAPEIYLFASPTGYSRSYDHNAQYNSDGYQLLAGVGLDRRLWTIELGGGYQQQFYLNSPIRTVSAPAVNATAIWRPTRLVTLSAFATESIQDPGLSPGPSPSLQVNRVLNSGVSADYEFSARLSAQIRGGFSELTQVNGGARADLWNGEARVVYNVTRNIKAYVDYSFARSLSATAYDEYMRNAVLIGFKCSY